MGEADDSRFPDRNAFLAQLALAGLALDLLLYAGSFFYVTVRLCQYIAIAQFPVFCCTR